MGSMIRFSGKLYPTFFLFWFAVLFTGGISYADTLISSNISANTTWTVAGSPYNVTSFVTVSEEATLIINPGVTVQFGPSGGLWIQGSIVANATANEQIHFTGDSSSPGSWYGIYLINSGSGAFSNCTFEYGGRYYNSTYSNTNLAKTGTGSLSITRCTFSNSSGNGLRVFANSGIVSASESTFSNNSSGVSIGLNISSDFINDTCIFTGNTYDVQIETNGDITTNTIWDLSSSYSMYLAGDLTVVSGATLTVASGTVIKSASARGIWVSGTLSVQGTAGAPVYFTDWRDDSVGGDANNNGNDDAAAPGWWRGIYVEDAGSADLTYCNVRYGGYFYNSTFGNTEFAKTGSGNLSLNNSSFSYSVGNGVRIFSNTGTLSASESTFSNNSAGVSIGLNVSSDFIDDTCIFSENTHDVRIEASGSITTNTTWDLNSSYSMYLSGDLTIAIGATLTVAPGTVVKSASDSWIWVNGALSVQGAAGAPVYFTDWRDDSVGGDANNNGTGDVPIPGWWHGIYVQDAGSADLTYCNVRYGGYFYNSTFGNTEFAKTGSGNLSLNNSSFSYSAGNGVRVFSNTGTLSAFETTFSNNNAGVSIGLNVSSDFIDDTCIFSDNTHDVQIEAGGTITNNTTWDLNSSYSMYLAGDLTVGNGATLTIASGTVIKSASARGIWVNGILSVQGTAGAPVYFTDWRDDSVGGDANSNGAGNAPIPGWWYGIYVQNTGSADLTHCSIRYGGYFYNSTFGNTGFAKTGTGDLVLNNVSFSYNSGNGLRIFSNAGTLSATESNFTNNGSGVSIGLNVSSSFIDDSCTFSGNTHDVQIEANGSITDNTTWDLNKNYSMYLSGNLTVTDGATLTIAPGTVIKSAGARGIWVKGTISAQGTAGSPVYFTDWRDDTVGGDANNDSGADEPLPGWWYGIYVEDAGSADLTYCSVRYGGYFYSSTYGTTSFAKTGSGNLSIDNVSFSNNNGNGLRIFSNTGALSATRSTFTNNGAGVSIGLNVSTDFMDDTCIFTDNTYDVQIEPGTVTTNTKWDLNHNYSIYISGSLTVADGVTLTVAPGTVVKSKAATGIWVYGTFFAQGTAGSPIYFTDWRDDSVGGDANSNGAGDAPAPGWWYGIYVENSGSADLTYCTVRYGGYFYNSTYGHSGFAKTGSGDLSLNNASFNYSSGNGLYIFNSTGNHSFKYCTFQGNKQGLRFLSPPGGTTVNLCSFDSNTEYGLYNSGSNIVDAINNWWGDASGPYHGSLNPAGQGDTISDNVLFDPWRQTETYSLINSPIRSGSIVVGDSLRFSGIPGDSVSESYFWDLGEGRKSTLLSPGVIGFHNSDDFTITFSLVDAQGTKDPNPGSRSITVEPNSVTIPDLIVTTFNVPPSLSVGQMAAISYSVKNIGDGAVASSSREDTLYLSADEYLDSCDEVLGTVNQTGSVAINGSYNGSLNVYIPATTLGSGYLILSADDKWAVLEKHQLNNEKALPTSIGVAELPGNLQSTGTLIDSREQFYKVNVSEGENLVLTFNGNITVYLKFGSLPSIGSYDYRQSFSGGGEIRVPGASPGDWYIMIIEDSGEAEIDYQITPKVGELLLSSVTPGYLAGNGDMAITVHGVGFLPGTTISLIGEDSTVYTANESVIDSYSQISATFEAYFVPAGIYDVQAQKDSLSDTIENGFTVVANGEAFLETNVVVPSVVGYHQLATVYVEYTNTGNAAMPAPLLVLTARQNNEEKGLMTLDKSILNKGFWTSAIPEGFSNTIQFLAFGETPGVLQPGESHRVPVYYAGWLQPWDFSYPPISFDLMAITSGSTEPVEWPFYKYELMPDNMDDDAWEIVWENFINEAGPTWGSFMSMINDNARYLGRLGDPVIDIMELFQFGVAQANGEFGIGILDRKTDVVGLTPDISLMFTRTFSHPISARFELGTLGWGWTNNWEISLSELSDGTIIIQTRNGASRIFQPDQRGGYFGETGDTGRLVDLGGGSYRLVEKDGTAMTFNSDGLLMTIADRNGNTVTCIYTGDLLTSLVHSSGRALTLAYNSDSRVESITDLNDDVTSFAYDPSGQYLSSVSYPDGIQLSYSYVTSAYSAALHALASITNRDGSHRYFNYNGNGRLSSTSRDNQEEAVTFSYDYAGMSATRDEITSTFLFNINGQLLKIQNSTGINLHAEVDQYHNPVSFTGANGRSVHMSYNDVGSPTQFTNPLGGVTELAYNQNHLVQSVTDSSGERTEYEYDTKGNLTTLYYPDGSSEEYSYNTAGNLSIWTNRRDEEVAFSYDGDGWLSGVEQSDGSDVTFTRDSRERLATATDSRGTTSFIYNTKDQLTRVDMPGGRYMTFTYDQYGRRTSITDQLGFSTIYEYDNLGRLLRVTDRNENEILYYTYDSQGRVIRMDKGNLSYTTYTYSLENLSYRITNYSPDDTVLSFFEYLFDTGGRIIQTETDKGDWSYTYDLADKLTRAVFTPANSGVLSQDLLFEYDSTGNRTRTIINGVETDYQSNNLDQYTQSGSTVNTFDADGNLTGRSKATQNWTYCYDDLKQLVSVTTPTDTFTYEYDAFGNRIAMVKNGQRREFVFDPLGQNRIIAEYQGDGSLVAHYHYGYALAGREDNAGANFYYDFNLVGSTVGITDASGDYVNQYTYLPFGELTSSTEAFANLFQFVGRDGVTSDSSGLNHMGARDYLPEDGRFLTTDPLGQSAGINLYTYVKNSPVKYIDPTGEELEDISDILGNLDPQSFIRSIVERGTEPFDKIVETFDNILDTNEIEEHRRRMEIAWATWDGVEWVQSIGNFTENPRWASADKIKNELLIIYLKAKHEGKEFLDVLGRKIRSGYDSAEKDFIHYRPIVESWLAARWKELWEKGSEAVTWAGNQWDSAIAQSVDPNEKTGPGAGAAGWVMADSILPYKIEFENNPDATAPAQVVSITDQLSSNLNWDSFQLTEVAFGDHLITISDNIKNFDHTERMNYNEKDLDVRIKISFNLSNGLLTAFFSTTDPETDLPPEVIYGFLPPEDDTGRGQGHISYIIQPELWLAGSTEIRNIATINFDFNYDIDTNQVDPFDPLQGTDPAKEALVTIDNDLPVSHVNALPGFSEENFKVSWSGADASSGIDTYSVYVRDRSTNSWETWLITTGTSSNFEGVVGHTYDFYCVATDSAGHVEQKGPVIEATTTVREEEEFPWPIFMPAIQGGRK